MTQLLDDLFYIGIKALIINPHKQILILEAPPRKTTKGLISYWDLPGGRMQPNEPIKVALQREVFEETGIKDLIIKELFDVCVANIRLHHPNIDSAGLTLLTYHCSIPLNQPIQLTPETISYPWATPLKVSELLENKYPSSFLDKIKQL